MHRLLLVATVLIVLPLARTAHAQFPLQIGGNGYDTPLYTISDGSNGFWMAGLVGSTDAVDFGGTSLTSLGGYDGFVARYNNSGALQTLIQIGGSGDDIAFAAALDGSEIIVCGSYSSTVDFDPSASVSNRTAVGGTDIFVARYTTAGSFVSVATMGGSGDEVARSCIPDGSGGVFLGGFFEGTIDIDPDPVDTSNLTSAGDDDLFLLRLDASNDLLWGFKIGDTGTDVTDRALVPDGSGGVVIGGYFTGSSVEFAPLGPTSKTLSAISGSDNFVSRYDSNGLLVSPWPVSLLTGAGFDAVRNVIPNGGTGYYTAGVWDGYGFVTQLSSSGSIVDVFFMEGTGFNPGIGLGLTGAGELLVSGLFENEVCPDSCEPINDPDSLVSLGQFDSYVVTLGTSLNYRGSFSIGGTGDDFAVRNPVIDGLGFFFQAGSFQNTVDFDPRPPVNSGKRRPTLLTSAGLDDIFVTKYDVAVSLPVELASFKTLVDGDAVDLSWQAVTQTNNAGFEVQMARAHIESEWTDPVRSGQSTARDLLAQTAREWKTISFVSGHGTTQETRDYSARINQLEPGTYNFRLKQIDFSGGITFSNTLQVEIALQDVFRISAAYPNPVATGSATVKLAVKANQNVRV
ncbi:MAG: hypothetical protein HKN13_06930, partial [Rhodothermales bacterium]|nr:hypothetical protein [Rhodothermales bacterium]